MQADAAGEKIVTIVIIGGTGYTGGAIRAQVLRRARQARQRQRSGVA
jgi:hypothetical protein